MSLIVDIISAGNASAYYDEINKKYMFVELI